MRIRTQLKEIASFSKGNQISGDDLIENGEYDYLNGGITPSGKWHTFNTPGGTVTISEGGNSCGFVNYMRNPFWCGAHCYYLFDTISNTEYLYYMLKSQQDRLMRIRTGACMPNIKKADLGSFEVEYNPDTVMQQHVVSTLKSVENVITARQKQLSILDDLIKARFIEMFGDPDTNPMQWTEYRLSEKLNVLGGYAFRSDGFSEVDGIPVLRIGNINAGFFRRVNMVFWEEDVTLERYILYPGDLVMSLTGTVGKEDYGNVCILGKEYPKYYLNQRNAKLELNEGLDKHYLSQLLRFEQIKKRLTGINRGVRQANISNKDILNLRVPIPPFERQQQFATFVAQIDKSKSAIQKSLDETQLLFDSLMQQYFG